MYFREVSVNEASNLEINYSVDFKKKDNRLITYSDKASKRLLSNTDVNDDQRDYQRMGAKHIENNLPTPPKTTKLVNDLPYQGELAAINISDAKSTSLVNLDNMPHARESADLFGDSISPGGLSELSCMNNISSCLRKTRSYPVTPNFDVCSEKLEIRDISECSPSSTFLSSSFNLIEGEQCQVTFNIQGDHVVKNSPERLFHTLSNGIKTPTCSNNSDENCIVQSEAAMSNNELVEPCRSENNFMSPENSQFDSNLFKTPQHLFKPFSNDIIEKPLSKNTILPNVTTHVNNMCLLSPNSVNNSQTAMQKHSTPEINPSPGSFLFSDSDTDVNLIKSPNDSIEMKSKHMQR